MKTETEQSIQRGCLALLNLYGWAVKVPAGGAMRGGHYVRLAPRGTPDLVGVVASRMIAVEVKKRGGRLRPGQGETLDTIRRNGGLALVVRSVSELEQALKAEGLV